MKNLIVRVHVTLLDIDPPVWRRVEAPADFTLARLHDVIQRVIGWEDRHLHHFDIQGVKYGQPSPEDAHHGLEIADESKVRIAALIDKDIRAFGYTYDYGDNWQLGVVLESVAPAHAEAVYPRLVGGARAGAPEDVGGPWSYADFLEALADEDHERHDELVEWIGDDFDPEHFDKSEINAALAKLAPRPAAKSQKARKTRN